MHEGTVRATSEGEGFGCTFVMELPLFHKSGQNVLEMGGTYAVETIPEGPEDVDLVSVDGALSSAPRDLESGTASGGGTASGSPAISLNKRYPVPQAPVQRSFFASMFGGSRVSLSGARQFLNQKVRFTMVHQPESTPSDNETAQQASEREHYCINSDFDDIEHGGEDSHDSYDESVQVYSSKKSSHDTSTGADIANSTNTSTNTRVVKIAGRVLSKASIVPVADDFEHTRADSFATLPLSGAVSGAVSGGGSAAGVSPKPFKEGELVDLEEPTPLESPMLNSKTSSSLSPHTPKSWTSKLRFLAVDDTALNRKMMARLLVSAGHLVDEACDGLECLAAMNLTANSTTKESAGNATINTKYDVVLMDENMPNLSGPEAAEKLRQAGYKGLIIGITGDCYQDQMDHFVQMGANAVLPKPLKLDHLRAKLEELWKF